MRIEHIVQTKRKPYGIIFRAFQVENTVPYEDIISLFVLDSELAYGFVINALCHINRFHQLKELKLQPVFSLEVLGMYSVEELILPYRPYGGIVFVQTKLLRHPTWVEVALPGVEIGKHSDTIFYGGISLRNVLAGFQLNARIVHRFEALGEQFCI
jgi:hypothetical protein